MELNVIWALLIALIIYALWVFNRLVAQRNACRYARAGIDVNLKKRHDLIPNLVDTVKGYTQHEQDTLVAVTTARTAAIAELGQTGSATAEDALASQLSVLNGRVEDYPDLKADRVFSQLMRNLTEVEEQISASRRAFNAQVMRMNNLVQQFPTNLIAGTFGFVALASYSADAAARLAPKVQLAPE